MGKVPGSSSPVARIQTIDALRGFALAGVATTHVVSQFVGGPLPEGIEVPHTYPFLDRLTIIFLNFFINGKFFAIFSILFGVSFSIQMGSAAKRGDNFALRFLWRSLILFGIGTLHQLFFRGDILTIYAFLSLFLIPFYRVKPNWILLSSGIFLLSLPRLMVYFSVGGDGNMGFVEAWTSEQVLSYYLALKEGSLARVFSFNLGLGLLNKLNFQAGPVGRLYLTFGYFLLGLWIGKMGILRNIPLHVRFIRKVLTYSLVAMVPAILLTRGMFWVYPKPIDLSVWQHVIGINFGDWANIALTLAIISFFVLAYQRKQGEAVLKFFVPYGRMALTNYVLQSVLGTWLLFGWGWGFLGYFSPVELMGMACSLVLIQTVFSMIWLRNFKYGPLEWAWRSATYFKIQPMVPAALPKNRATPKEKLEPTSVAAPLARNG